MGSLRWWVGLVYGPTGFRYYSTAAVSRVEKGGNVDQQPGLQVVPFCQWERASGGSVGGIHGPGMQGLQTLAAGMPLIGLFPVVLLLIRQCRFVAGGVRLKNGVTDLYKQGARGLLWWSVKSRALHSRPLTRPWMSGEN
jgi:hypothetical protein